MRRFLIYSLLALLPLAHVKACISEGHLHNSYMFSVFHRNALTYGPAYLYSIDRYWQSYTGNDGPSGTTYYKWNREEIMKTASSKGDREMMAYLTLLNRYLNISEAYATDAWDYPTKQ